MKAHTALIDGLNDALADEVAAISQYMVQSEMNKGWGYDHLHDAVRGRAMDEMRHAEMLIERILFLGGTPSVSKPLFLHIGRDVREQITNDLADEHSASEQYNKLIDLATREHDKGSEDVLAAILRDEEVHMRVLEGQKAQIEQMGLENFLATQAR